MFSLDNRRTQESHLAIADKGGFNLPLPTKFVRTPALRPDASKKCTVYKDVGK